MTVIQLAQNTRVTPSLVRAWCSRNTIQIIKGKYYINPLQVEQFKAEYSISDLTEKRPMRKLKKKKQEEENQVYKDVELQRLEKSVKTLNMALEMTQLKIYRRKIQMSINALEQQYDNI